MAEKKANVWKGHNAALTFRLRLLQKDPHVSHFQRRSNRLSERLVNIAEASWSRGSRDRQTILLKEPQVLERRSERKKTEAHYRLQKFTKK